MLRCPDGRPRRLPRVTPVSPDASKPLRLLPLSQTTPRRYTGRCSPSAHTEVASMSDTFAAIESSLQEKRVFPPPPHFAAEAKINSLEDYKRLYRESIDDPEHFWGRAAEELFWFKKWDKVLEWNPPNAKWF